MRLEEVEHHDGHLIVKTQRKSCGVHHAQLFLETIEIGDGVEAFGFRIFFRITVIDTVHLSGFKDNFSSNLIGAECGGCISLKVGITSS